MQSTRRILIVCVALGVCPKIFAADDNAAKKKAKPPAIRAADADGDFALQGEYAGTFHSDNGDVKFGVQVIALGDGHFEAVGYPGGLPGAGWDGQSMVSRVAGALKDGAAVFETENARAVVKNDQIQLLTPEGREISRMDRVVRKSPTLGQKPPAGAIVLFDGKSAANFADGKMTDDGLLIQGATSRQTFQDCTLHVEFMLSYMPAVRGQGRSNSGCYLQGRYEVQILDSFGLEGKNNECGGIYEIKAPLVNMCLPPLAWQTYDIDYTAAKFGSDGKKTADARITVKHNGVLIQDNVAIPKKTRAAPVEEGPSPGPVFLQDHKNPVRFRNIWVLGKSEK